MWTPNGDPTGNGIALNLAGSLAGKRVLDVGCGNGYHCWRMLGRGAAEVIGIDPTPLFILQFKALQHYLQQDTIHVLPLTLEAMPEDLPAFDTVFSMGVLYHRRDPLAHLMSLKAQTRAGRTTAPRNAGRRG